MIKRITHLLLALLYLAAIVVSVLIAVKPGAAIFYYKQTLAKQYIKPDAGYAYRYTIKTSPIFIRYQGAQLFEDGHLLTLSSDSMDANLGQSLYSIDQLSSGRTYLYFSSSDNSNPITNGRNYRLYLPLRFVSRQLGVIYLLILLPGAAWFLVFALAIREHRRTFLQSPQGVLIVLDRFFENISLHVSADTHPIGQLIRARLEVWKQLFAVTVLVAFLYIFMEWFFFVTKPSFMSIMGVGEKMGIFILSGLAFSAFSIAALLVYAGLDLLAVIARRSAITRYLGIIIPTIILSALALLLIDNFTYTVLKFGISTSSGIGRAVYGIVFLGILVYVYSRMMNAFGLKGNSSPNRQITNRLFITSVTLIIIGLGVALAQKNYGNSTALQPSADVQRTVKFPDILLFGGDGLSADHLSVYGYSRDTTPRLKELAQTSLVAENAFTNAGNSAGSVISILTSKLPTTTRVEFSPDILTGINSFQHLPGILKNVGYKTIEFGIPSYVDAYNLNMQNAFDMVNYRSQSESRLGVYLRRLGFDNPAYFVDRITERISDRILHIFFIRMMENPYRLVTQPADSISDQEKIDQTLSLLDQSQEPVFIHLHLLGTHGPKFNPLVQVYSKGEDQNQTRMVDFYDDAILSFDHYVGEVIDHLQATGELDNTVLIIYTDHPAAFQVHRRIPLIMYFPSGSHTGRITQNVENLDIAPTLLDYLGLAQPGWMKGTSLLKGNLESHRLIFSAGTDKVTNDSDVFLLDPEQIKPPFYQFNYITAIDCQKWYWLDLSTHDWSSGDVPSYTAPCSMGSLLSVDNVRQAMYDQLASDGFDISSLP